MRWSTMTRLRSFLRSDGDRREQLVHQHLNPRNTADNCLCATSVQSAQLVTRYKLLREVELDP